MAPSVNGDGTELTRREVEVVRLLADGLTNREIAKRLFISEKTVSAHVAHIYSKLDVHSRVAAAARVHHLGVLEQPPEGRAGRPDQGGGLSVSVGSWLSLSS